MNFVWLIVCFVNFKIIIFQPLIIILLWFCALYIIYKMLCVVFVWSAIVLLILPNSWISALWLGRFIFIQVKTLLKWDREKKPNTNSMNSDNFLSAYGLCEFLFKECCAPNMASNLWSNTVTISLVLVRNAHKLFECVSPSLCLGVWVIFFFVCVRARV